MSGRNRRAADKFATFERDFDKVSKKSFAKTSNKYGKKIVKDRQKQLGNVDERRKAGVWHKVTRNGGLVIMDLAPLAAAQEFGKIIGPTGDVGYLRVPLGKENKGPQKDDSGNFVVRTHSGTMLLMNKDGEPIATLEKRVVIKRNNTNGRFATAIDKNLRKYQDELIQEVLREWQP
jgi:hypothetical protein